MNNNKPESISYNQKYNLFINDVKCSTAKKFYIQYKCITCESLNQINSYKRFICKLQNKNTICYCVHCIQKYDVFGYNKLRSHILSGVSLKKREKFNLKKKEKKNELCFQNESKDFQEDYWKRNYTKQQWDSFVLNNNIVKINQHYLDQIIQFMPHQRCFNQMKFSPKIRTKENIQPIKQVYSVCENCNKEYKIHWKKHLLANKKQKKCRNCFLLYFSNKTWKTKAYTNCIGGKILYQSQYELQFIKWCNDNNILIYNGPSLDYFWNKKNRKYRVDFYIPKINILIQLKDEHRFHKQQLENGKWCAKQDVAKHAVEEGLFNEYILLFKKQFTNSWKENFLQFYNNNIV